jgi:hypothetical protein
MQRRIHLAGTVDEWLSCQEAMSFKYDFTLSEVSGVGCEMLAMKNAIFRVLHKLHQTARQLFYDYIHGSLRTKSFIGQESNTHYKYQNRPPLWTSGQNLWLQIQRSRV